MRRYMLIAAVALLVAGGSAQANLLIPGGTVVPDPFSAANDVTLLASTSGTWTTPGVGGSGGAKGSFTDAVYSTTTPGTLDFVYQFSNSAGSDNSITETTGLSYLGFTPLDVGSMANGGSLPGGIFVNGTTSPFTISEDGLGTTVTNNFSSPEILPGVTSAVLVVRATATNFTSGMVGVIAGGTTNLPGFEPSAVPEPSLFLPLGLGLLAAVAFGRRKFGQRT